MTKLIGTGTNGNFVHQTQQMSGNVGFKCVSRLWYDKTKPMSDGIQQLSVAQKARKDYKGDKNHFIPRVNGVNEVVFEAKDGAQFKPTEHCWRTICTRYKLPQTTVFHFLENSPDAADNDILVKVLENARRKMKQDDKFLFRTYGDGTLRAMLTDDYAIIDNVWVLETIASFFKGASQEPRLSHWRGDGDTIYGNLLIPDTCREEDDSDYGGMLSLSNCEVGTRRLGQYPSIFRAICMNGCIWDQKKGETLSKVHRGRIDYSDLRDKIFDNLNNQIPLMSTLVNNFLTTKNLRFDESKVRRAQVVAKLAIDFKLPKNFAFNVGTTFRDSISVFGDVAAQDSSLFGVINALTRAGQKYDNKMWNTADIIAGELVKFTPSKWDDFVADAGKLTKERMLEVFAQ